jgi:hypothetical protein
MCDAEDWEEEDVVESRLGTGVKRYDAVGFLTASSSRHAEGARR